MAEKILNTTPAPKARKVDTSAKIADLASARLEYISTLTNLNKAEAKAYGAGTKYAAMLTKTFGKGWEAIAAKPAKQRTGNEAKTGELIDAEKRSLRETLKARKYPEKGLDVPWSRTRKVASEITAGLRYEADGAPIPGKVESKKPVKLSAEDMAAETLTNAYQRFQKLAQDDKYDGYYDCGEIARRIARILSEGLGVDTATLVKVKA